MAETAANLVDRSCVAPDLRSAPPRELPDLCRDVLAEWIDAVVLSPNQLEVGRFRGNRPGRGVLLAEEDASATPRLP